LRTRSEARGEHRLPERLATGPNTNVLMVAEFGPDVQRYARDFASLTFPRPRACLRCNALDRFGGHGSYPRNAVDHVQTVPIRVKRFLCAACHKTVSVLPTFCLPRRHYQTSTVQVVLDVRIPGQASWSAIRARFLPADLPTHTTCREWVGAFAKRSQPYLGHLLGQLSRWQLAPGKIEVALDEMAIASRAPAQLVAAVPHLVAFLRDNGVNVADGSTRWLATLWQWGHTMKLGRLV